MRADMLDSLLKQLNSSSTDIEASAIISTDGLTIASMLPAGMDEDRVGAMSAAMLSMGDRTSQELARGSMEQVLVKGDNGYLLMTYAGENAVLTVLTKGSAKLGLIFLDVKRTAASTSKAASTCISTAPRARNASTSCGTSSARARSAWCC